MKSKELYVTDFYVVNVRAKTSCKKTAKVRRKHSES